MSLRLISHCQCKKLSYAIKHVRLKSIDTKDVSIKSPKLKEKRKSTRYSDTLNLPQTKFALSMKNGASAKRESEIQKTSFFTSLYAWQREQDWDRHFVLHDGPPYANGRLHVGHFVNKVLKDITNRYKILKKHKVHYVPGWDCHGMPIEMKAITDKEGNYLQLSSIEIRRKAKSYAKKQVKEQKSTFKQWGVLGDWEGVYTTLSPSYEAEQLKIFYSIYEKGVIYRDYMPVYWSPSSQTALAEAELEYNPNHISKAVFIKFPIVSLPSEFTPVVGNSSGVYAVVWTTTPWTVPFNQALCYGPKLRYVFLKDTESSEVFLCEEMFVGKLAEIVSKTLVPLLTIDGMTLKSAIYAHPLTGEPMPFVGSNHVASGKGAGLVHTAPAHGHDDFQVATQYGLSRECHVDGRGVFVSGVDDSLIGKTVGVDADDAVLSALGPLALKVEPYTHSYPYDWRTKKPVIIRASKQWFIDTHKLRPLALESLRNVKITPPQSEHGMLAELNSRPYWCISRQRSWGVPLPVFTHNVSGELLITKETVDHIRGLIEKHGSDCWWTLPTEDLLPDSLLMKLNKGKSSDYTKGEDILDIWFDSGVSWASVLKDSDGVADVYLEGIDQFKGWFQTSLLTSVAVREKAPYKHIITHGFATDEEGKKMAKSVGNVVDPEIVIYGGKDQNKWPSYGVDVLRWWVAHSHHHPNIMVGPLLLKQFSEDVFKVRKCVRFLLGNLFDFNPATDIVPYTEMTPVDKYLLYVLYTTMVQIEQGFESISYNKVIQNLEKFVYSDLSSFYINNTRDRCYCYEAGDQSRRSSQTVQYHVIRSLASAFAPIMPHLAEDVISHMPDYNKNDKDSDSVFKLGWAYPDVEWNNPKSADDLMPVFDMKRTVMDKIGLERPVEFDIFIYSSPKLRGLLNEIQPEPTSSSSSLCEIFQTSNVAILNAAPHSVNPEDDTLVVSGTTNILDSLKNERTEVDYKILVAPAMNQICERCRRYTSTHGSTPCERCLNAMAQDWAS